MICKKYSNLNEFIFALYLYLFVLLRPVLGISGNLSTVILFLSSIFLIFINIFYNYFYRKEKINLYSIKGLLFIFIILSLIFLDIIIRPNSRIYHFIYDFFIYGAIPIYFFIYVKNPMKFIYYFGVLSIIIFIIYAYDPFVSYRFSKGYMTYGFSIMLPSFIGTNLLINIFNKKKLIFIEWIIFGLSLFFANKGTIISIIVYIIIIRIFIQKNNTLKLLFFFICSIPILYNLETLIERFIILLNKWGYKSYSLTTIYNVLTGTSNGLSGRELIWENAWKMINDKVILGHGLGAFESIYTGYSHNFILDIFLSYGVVGIAIVCFIFFIGVKRFLFAERSNKILYIFFFSLCIPKLLTSSYFFSEMSFWLLIFINIAGTNYKNTK